MGRALAVLDVFASSGRPRLTAHSIVQRLDLPRTTVLRMIETLRAERMLDALPDGSIALGPRMARWAQFADLSWAMPQESQERLARVAEVTGETASLYLRDGTRRLALAQAPGPHSLRHVVDIGDRLPLWRGASAMVVLSAAPEDETTPEALERLREDPAAPEFDAEVLSRRVAEARAAGWAVTHGEREAGISGVAVPLEWSSRAIAIAVGGPTARFTPERVADFVDELRAAAADLRSSGLPPALTEF